ncbi:hypothetical protein TIFTF001_039478 [Ficus carica]|uniref:Uncharacterized protein n=1 Tax=Ficus carica TaxID=3494 RepID=A0AA88EA03_FICCA|nr:hypothetical protein TIFTF001_039478 [Ficus carica]
MLVKYRALSKSSQPPEVERVGVILDMQSPVGSIARDYISMEISYFYSKHSNFRTRLVLSWRDSGNDTVAAALTGSDD